MAQTKHACTNTIAQCMPAASKQHNLSGATTVQQYSVYQPF